MVKLLNIVRFLTVVACFWLGSSAQAVDPEKSLDQLVHKNWTTADGLPQNSVNDIVQTPDGYLWLATFGGPARFDGQKFTVFDTASSPGLTLNRVTALHVDPDGVLWLGGDLAHLCRYENETFSCLKGKDGVPKGFFRAMESDGNALWIGTSVALARFENGEFQFFEGLEPPFEALYRDATGLIWASSGAGPIRWNGERWEAGPSLHADGIGQPMGQGDAGGVLRDRDGNIWFVDSGTRGVGRLRAGRSTDDGERLFTGQRSLTIYEDRDGNLWVGTNNHGLHLLRDGIFVNLNHGASTASVYETVSGRLLVGTLCSGAFERIDGLMVALDDPPGLNCVSTVFEDRRGRLWVGGEYLALRERGRWTRFREQGVEYLPMIRALYEDWRGTVWIGAEDGLASYSEGRYTEYSRADGVQMNSIRFVTEDRQGNLWIMGPSGLMRFEAGVIRPETGRLFTRDDGLGHNYVRMIYEAENGALWIGTYGGGLGHMSPGDQRITNLTRANGLAENVVSTIVEENGNLWLSGNRGITRLRRGAAEAFIRGDVNRVSTVLYNEVDGMLPSETNGGFQPAVWKARDGRLLYSTIRGVAVMDPAGLRLEAPPTVVIERVRVGGREVDFRQTVVVRPGEKNLEIDYTALQLGLPEEARFRYRLVNDGGGWDDVGDRRTAYYNAIAPGTYTFELTASAYSGGLWNTEVASFKVVVEPFFYETLLFRIALGLAFVGLIVLFFSYRLRKMRRRESAMQTVIDELEAKNAEMERFTYTVSHDLRSPLVTIEGFTGYLLDDALSGNQDRLRNDVAQIRHATSQMSELLSDLLELSRIGRLVNTPVDVSLTEIARDAEALAAGRLQDRGVVVEIAEDLPVVLVDRVRMVEVFQNLLDNAARFMGDQEEPRVWISSRKVRHETVITVRDNGAGIAPKYHRKVFELFERLDARTDGTGIGLAIVKRVIEHHGGRIWIESEGKPGAGTAFRFTLDWDAVVASDVERTSRR